MTDQTVLVTGANRGLGLGVARDLGQRGYHVIVASRDLAKAEAAARTLQAEGLSVEPRKLDVRSDYDLAALKRDVDGGKLVVDILINNAGVFQERQGGDILHADVAIINETMATNATAALQLIQIVVPGMLARKWGRIVNVSSGMGGLTEMEEGSIAYRMSKAALNVVTRVTANETRGSGVLVNSVCPGWVRTDMGGPGAHREIDEGAASIVWAAILPGDGPSGGFFRDGEPLKW
jgi:NAD(P)-dependent dehydrogenase (short-subunit alcohol dehydrogenase family)